MRIGIVAPPWIPVPPPAYGGIEAMVDTLARGLSAAGHEVLLAAAAGSTCPVDLVPGLPAGNLDTMGACVDELRHSILAHEAMAGMDLIHDHTLSGPLYRYRPADVPLVTTAHGAFGPGTREVYRAMARGATVVGISHHQARSAPPGTITRVIHHGMDATSVPVGDGAGGYACFLGRMHPDKGIQEAIDVARRAGMPLLIAAKMNDSFEQGYYREVIKPLLGHGVDYLGELNTAEKYVLLGSATALLNPIQWAEPFGMVMIEALASGTPVVGTTSGSAPEIVDDGVTGFLRNGTEALATALQATGTLDRSACRRSVETRFSAERMVGQYLRLYRDVLAGPRVIERRRMEYGAEERRRVFHAVGVRTGSSVAALSRGS